MTLRRYRRLVAERTRRQLAALVRVAARARLQETWDTSCVAGIVEERIERAPPPPDDLLTAAKRGVDTLPPPRPPERVARTVRREVLTA
jgi:hypothetical protein